jgi:hypothetical protein
VFGVISLLRVVIPRIYRETNISFCTVYMIYIYIYIFHGKYSFLSPVVNFISNHYSVRMLYKTFDEYTLMFRLKL